MIKFSILLPVSTPFQTCAFLKGMLLFASCYGNRDKLQPDGTLGSNADLTYCIGGGSRGGARGGGGGGGTPYFFGNRTFSFKCRYFLRRIQHSQSSL